MENEDQKTTKERMEQEMRALRDRADAVQQPSVGAKPVGSSPAPVLSETNPTPLGPLPTAKASVEGLDTLFAKAAPAMPFDKPQLVDYSNPRNWPPEVRETFDETLRTMIGAVLHQHGRKSITITAKQLRRFTEAYQVEEGSAVEGQTRFALIPRKKRTKH